MRRSVPMRSSWLSGLARERLADERADVLVGARRAAPSRTSSSSSLNRHVRSRAVGGEPQAVALAAEVVRQRRDDADRAGRLGEAVVARGTPAAGCVVALRPAAARRGPRPRPRPRCAASISSARDVVRRASSRRCRRHRSRSRGALGRVAHRHVLDEAHVQRAVERHPREAEQVLVAGAHDDDVELDRVECRPSSAASRPASASSSLPPRVIVA